MARDAEDVLKQIEARLTGNEPQVSAVIKSLGDIRGFFSEERIDVPDNLKELMTGEYDAVATLQQCLQMAEDGEINRVMIVTQCVPEGEIKGTEGQPYVYYSEMPRYEILWLIRFANSFVNHRFFGQFHEEDD